jgi:starch phosphorylase
MLILRSVSEIKQDIKTLDKVDMVYKKTSEWAEKSILAAASMGKFSSDRSIHEYARRIWNVEPVPVE